LEYCHQRPTIKSPKYGIVENATDDLLFTSFECEQVAKIVPVKQRLKGSKEATIAEYRNMVKSINGLHSSHHAKSDLTSPLKSHLLLGDGSITLGELMTPAWRMPELSDVFLSCCETNLGVTKITDDILSLGTGFLCAGARSVVSTLWEVHQVTGLFSIFYYQYRQKGLSRPEALRDAQVRLRTISGEGLHQLCDLIIKKLNGNLLKVQGEKEELKLRHKSYKRGTVEYKELKDKLLGIVKQESKIQEEIEWYKGISKQFSAMPNPFDDLIYWSGFICQGLH
jgi:CHAT domain-containing protein